MMSSNPTTAHRSLSVKVLNRRFLFCSHLFSLFSFCAGCRTPCKYAGKDIDFHVTEGSNGYWISPLVKGRDADIIEQPSYLPPNQRSNLAAEAPYVPADLQYQAPQMPQAQVSQSPQSQQVPQFQEQWPQPPPFLAPQTRVVQSQSQITARPSAVYPAYVQNQPLDPPPREQLPSSIPMQMLAPGVPQQSRN